LIFAIIAMPRHYWLPLRHFTLDASLFSFDAT
jgi:hypothetical protein